MPFPRVAATLAATTLIQACSAGERPTAANAAERRGRTIVAVPSAAYAAVRLSASGAVTGRVSFTGAAPDDSIVAVARDTNICGTAQRQIPLEADDDRLAGALVWLPDIRQGQALPLTKRFELVLERCVFTPAVQAVIARGTLNIRSDDALVTRLAVVDVRTLDTVAVMPFNDAGQVVPLDRPLRRPAMLEVRSRTHPWVRAWVAVLDHPYAALSARDGVFRIDSIPPGRHRVNAWHPGFGIVSGTAVVRSGAEASIELRYGTDTTARQRAMTRSTAIATNSTAR